MHSNLSNLECNSKRTIFIILSIIQVNEEISGESETTMLYNEAKKIEGQIEIRTQMPTISKTVLQHQFAKTLVNLALKQTFRFCHTKCYFLLIM